ncbi:pimeloyl-ACP methyl ester carboxylesterase [Rhizobium sp. BK377]|nr:pimeloyl-ACP methyl ester carboxylesterase [Rhizobium sp. BK377]
MSNIELANLTRRSFSGAALGLTATGIFGTIVGTARADQTSGPKQKAVPLTASETVDAGDLKVAYSVGPKDGSPVILLHGWPYDIHSFAAVAPILADRGHRVVIPYLRGYGGTTFLSKETKRNGQQSALAVDAIKLMDALNIDRATIAGFDWGARTADIVAALWPERCKALVSVSGYLIGNQAAGKVPLSEERREVRVAHGCGH